MGGEGLGFSLGWTQTKRRTSENQGSARADSLTSLEPEVGVER